MAQQMPSSNWYQDQAGNWYYWYSGSWYLYYKGFWYRYYYGSWFVDYQGNWYYYQHGILTPYNPSQVGQSSAVNIPLPDSGLGFITYQDPSRRFGTQHTIDALTSIASSWYDAHRLFPPVPGPFPPIMPMMPLISIGDISLQGGGPFVVNGQLAHLDHQNGQDADILPMRNDIMSTRVTITDPLYNQGLTRNLLQTIHAYHGDLSSTVFFNDTQLINEGLCRFRSDCNDHLQVSFAVV